MNRFVITITIILVCAIIIAYIKISNIKEPLNFVQPLDFIDGFATAIFPTKAKNPKISKTIKLDIKTNTTNCSLLFIETHDYDDFILLYIESGMLGLEVFTSKNSYKFTSKIFVADNLWHTVEVNHGYLTHYKTQAIIELKLNNTLIKRDRLDAKKLGFKSASIIYLAPPTIPNFRGLMKNLLINGEKINSVVLHGDINCEIVKP